MTQYSGKTIFSNELLENEEMKILSTMTMFI